MSPEEALQLKTQVEELKTKLDAFLFEYNKTNYPSKMVISKDVDFERKVSYNGTLNISSLQLTSLGINKTPVSQQPSIADPTGGSTVDTEARTVINLMLDVFDAFGFTA